MVGAALSPRGIFSFEILKFEQKEEAQAFFDRERKGSCILLNNIAPLACRLADASTLTAADLAELIDVTITPEDFAWTYSKTHEGMYGPYFYTKRQEAR